MFKYDQPNANDDNPSQAAIIIQTNAIACNTINFKIIESLHMQSFQVNFHCHLSNMQIPGIA